VVEGWVPFTREVSVLGARSATGEVAVWPAVENVHRDGQLARSRAPVDAPGAEQVVRTLLDGLGYVGVLAVELFDTPEGLVVNELAPRVHNTGHWTIEGAVTSQFEQHLRAVLGLPLGSTAATGASVMVNLLGALPPLEELLAVPGAHVHGYGKAPRPGRKVGHVTLVASDEAELAARLAQLDAALACADA
jgi:5-(carboxyamino)imidazole ribonucleotide synthase